MAEGPRISTVIATYNRPRSLAACLESLEGQTVAPLEVIIVVDGELTEQVQETIDTFKGDGKLKIVQINNGERRGATASKNRGAEAASGDIIAFVDDDITLVPHWTAQILKGYEENEDAVAVGGVCEMSQWLFHNPLYRFFVAVRWRLFRNKIGKMSFIGMPYLSHTLPGDGCVAVDFLHGGNMTVLREAFLATRLDEAMGVRDEFDLCVRLRKNGGRKLIYNPQAVAYHNVVTSGGFGVWGHERICLDVRDHVPYLMKDYNLRYLRLGVFSALVLGYALLTLKPRYVKALWDGIGRYRSWRRSQRAIASV
ncbi:MAG TPA: glycosyltransferase family 2 protein [Dehalococcoidia bacterium]|nr:glycosyltransferase family 2 protein [Dehalococcoidia bacterium]